MPGNAIVLVGVSSVGKTSVAEQLQLALREPYLHVGIDHFFSMFPYEWLDHPRQPGPGFWVETTTDPDGSPVPGSGTARTVPSCLPGCAAVNALLATGNNVILDEMPIDDTIVPAWRRELRAASVLWVHLTASLPSLEQREMGRTKGRVLGNARGHLDVTVGRGWDLVIDTERSSPAGTATAIVRALKRDRHLDEGRPGVVQDHVSTDASWTNAVVDEYRSAALGVCRLRGVRVIRADPRTVRTESVSLEMACTSAEPATGFSCR